jgi:hypothetical protein
MASSPDSIAATLCAKLTIKTGKNTGQNPSIASVYRALADADETA